MEVTTPLIEDSHNIQYKHIKNLNVAYEISTFSKAERKKVGSIIVDKDGRIVGTGFNGTPAGVNNVCEENNKTLPYVLHAELNAIVNTKISDLSGCTIYITLSPCIHCAAIILQKKIKRVIYHEEYRDTEGIKFLKDHGVEVIEINQELFEIVKLERFLRTLSNTHTDNICAKYLEIISNWHKASDEDKELILDITFNGSKFCEVKTLKYFYI